MAALACEQCDYTTEDVKPAILHATETGHRLSGPGNIEGTTWTISFGTDDDEWGDDDNDEWGDDEW